MKKWLILGAMLPSIAFAAHSGAYITAGAGYGFYSSPDKNLTGTTNGKHENRGNMWQVDAGYRFKLDQNWFIGFETGYVNNAHARYEQYSPSSLSGTITQTQVNALFNLNYAMSNGINFYGLGGMARVRQEISTTGSPSDFTQGIQTLWRPKAGLGMGYIWPNHLGLIAMWEHIFGATVANFPITGQTKIITSNTFTLNFMYIF